MAADGTIVIDTEIDSAGAEKDLDKVEKKTMSLETAASKATVAFAVLTAGIALTAAAAYNAGAEYETSLAKLSTIADTNKVSIDEFSEGFKDLAVKTGQSASSLADVAYNAISAGASTEDAMKTAESAAKLATAGFTDTASALSLLTTTQNAYGDQAGTLEQISDGLIQVQNLGVTTVAELSSVMGKAIATGSAYGVSMGNLESAYVSLTKQGINTAEATTYMSGMMSELGDSGSNVGKILLEKTGKSFGQLMADGASLGDVIGILNDSVGGNAEALMNLWGSQEAGKASNAIVNEGLTAFNDNLATITGTAGTTEEAFGKMSDTTAFKMAQMKEQGINLLITAFDAFKPVLDDVISLFMKVGEFLTEHPTLMKILIIAVIAITVAIGAFAVAMNIATIATTVFGVATGVAFWWILLIIAIIIAVIAVIVLLVKHWDTVKETVLNVVGAIKDALVTLASWIYDHVIAPIVNFFLGMLDNIIKIFTTIKDFIVGIFEKVVALVKAPINFMIDGLNALIGGLNKIKLDIPSWVPKIGGMKFGFNIDKIPHLATGTVVPASSGEFAAVLGDNNRETEVVSPLSTIKQALREEMGTGNGKQPINIYLGSRLIYQEIIDLNEQNTLKTGRNAFA